MSNMAKIPINKYPNQAGYTVLDTERNILQTLSDGYFKDMSNTVPEDWVNVKDFGAKGDGITDDTQAIQNAINTEATNTIYFPNGNYLILSQLIIQNNKILIGNGRKSTIIINQENGNIFLSFHSNILITNIRFTSQNFDKTLKHFHENFSMMDSNNITFDNVIFENLNGEVISTYRTNNLVISNSYFYNAGRTTFRLAGYNGKIINNIISSDLDFENRDYFSITGNSDFIIAFNKTSNCGQGNSDTANGTWGNTYGLWGGKTILIGNTDTNPRWSNCLLGTNQYDTIIENNYFESVREVSLWSEQSGNEYCIINNNIFKTGAISAGAPSGGNKLIISNNIFKELIYHLGFGDGSQDITISNNYIEFLNERDYAIDGVNKNKSATKLTITNNHIVNAKNIFYAWQLSGDRTLNNTIIKNNIISAISAIPSDLLNPQNLTLVNVIKSDNIFSQIIA